MYVLLCHVMLSKFHHFLLGKKKIKPVALAINDFFVIKILYSRSKKKMPPPENVTERKRKRPEREESDLEQYDIPRLASHYGWGEDDYIVGIDEAGRGPAIGPMVYCAFGVRIGSHDALDCLGVKDSKVLNHKQREELFPTLVAQYTPPRYMHAVDVIAPDRISAAMSCKDGTQTLNTVSHNSAIELLRSLMGKGKVVAVYVDTVGPADKYREKIKKHFPGLHVIVTSKADARFACVSAASIVAKVTRDSHLEELNKRSGQNMGCGYPSDPATQKWLASTLHPFYGFPEDVVRMRWGTVEKLLTKNGVPVTFSSEEKGKVEGQRTLQAFAHGATDHHVLSHVLRVSHVYHVVKGSYDDDDA